MTTRYDRDRNNALDYAAERSAVRELSIAEGESARTQFPHCSGRQCRAQDKKWGYNCTMEEGHHGPHAAHAAPHLIVVATWSSVDHHEGAK